MNVRALVTLRLPRRNRPIHVSRNIYDIWGLRYVRFRRLFNHVVPFCNSRAVPGVISRFSMRRGGKSRSDPNTKKMITLVTIQKAQQRP